jgi:hypothetical protein
MLPKTGGKVKWGVGGTYLGPDKTSISLAELLKQGYERSHEGSKVP